MSRADLVEWFRQEAERRWPEPCRVSLAREWCRSEYPHWAEADPGIVSQLSDRDLREARAVLRTAACPYGDQRARYSFRVARRRAEARGLTVREIAPGLTTAVLRKLTRDLEAWLDQVEEADRVRRGDCLSDEEFAEMFEAVRIGDEPRLLAEVSVP